MNLHRAMAAVGAAVLLGIAGGKAAYPQDLDASLQTAVKAQEWNEAISIVDRLIDRNGSTPELIGYRQQLIDLAAAEHPQPTSASTSTATIDGIPLSEVADYLNQTLPLQLDDNTELTSATASGNRLIYTGRMVGFSAGEIDASRFSSRFFKDSFARIVCPNPEVLYVLERGIELEYVLVDRHNDHLTTVEVNPQVCQV